jgi:hypothetical protein
MRIQIEDFILMHGRTQVGVWRLPGCSPNPKKPKFKETDFLDIISKFF